MKNNNCEFDVTIIFYIDYFSFDHEYSGETFTIEKLRKDICSEIFKDENKSLHNFLCFGRDFLDPEDWNDLMNQVNKDSLHCDLPFVQLASNYLKREIDLIPIRRIESRPVISIQKIIKVTPNETTSDDCYRMLYYPKGEFAPHSYYQSVFIDEQLLEQSGETTSAENLSNILANEKILNISNIDEDSDDDSNDDENPLSSSTKEKKHRKKNENPKKMKKQPNYRYNETTLLTPIDPTSNIVVNNTEKTIKKRIKKNAPVIEIAPGEGKIPTNWLREKDNDIDSFPELHPEGRFGLDHDRSQKLTKNKYYGQRIMNEEPMYSENANYLFMAQQSVERSAIEREINMAMSQGSIKTNDKGEKSYIPSDDAYNIFQKIPGTPAYWKSFKNELYAKMEALGPFHVFFTFSCAEMKWASVLLEVLKVKLRRQLKIFYLDNFINSDGISQNVAWDGEPNTVLLYDEELSDVDTTLNDNEYEISGKRVSELKDIIDKIIKDVKKYKKEVASKKRKSDPVMEKKLKMLDSLDYKLEDKDQQMDLIKFLIQFEDNNNKLKMKDIVYIATSINVSQRSKIMTLESYLRRYLKQHSINKIDFLKDNFMLVTLIFDKRAKDFLETILKKEGIEDYAYRVEWQIRGLPHIHGAGWMRRDLLKDCLDKTGCFLFQSEHNADKTNEALIELIEKWISCSLSTGDEKLDSIVRESQMHKHTAYSCNKSGKGCRFSFPKPPSNKCMISRPVTEIYPNLDEAGQQSILEEAKTMMTKVKTALDELEYGCTDYDDNLEKFLQERCGIANIDYYHELLQISVSGKTVILKRKVSEVFVNNYNKVFLKHWNANTDIQICLDSFAVVTYITDYLTKSDRNVTEALMNALKSNKHEDKFGLLNYLKKIYFLSKQTCVSEATYRLIPGLDLKGSTRACLFVNSGFPHERWIYLQKITDDKDDESERDQIYDSDKMKNSKNYINIDNNKYIEPESKHKKYEMRPRDENCNLFKNVEKGNIFENMCFAKFSVLYEYNANETEKILWHNCEGKQCDVDLDMIEAHFKKKNKPSKMTSGTKKHANPNLTEESEDSEDIISEQEDEEESVSITSSLPSKQLRLGPPKKGSHSVSEIGFTKRYFDLMKEPEKLEKLLKIEDRDGGNLLLPQWIRLSNGKTMKLRTKPYALKLYLFPKDGLQQQYSELLLFTSWRNEKLHFWSNKTDEEKSQDLSPDDPVFTKKLQTMFNLNEYEWEKNREAVVPFSNKMNSIKEMMQNENFARSQTVYDSIDSYAEQENAEDAANLDNGNEEVNFPDGLEIQRNRQKHNIEGSKKEKCVFKIPTYPSSTEERNTICQSIRNLTYEQRVVFDKFIHYFQSLINVQNGGDIIPEPPMVIMQGKYFKLFKT